MRLRTNIFILFICFTTLFFSSCRKKFDTGWDTNLLAPLVEGTLTIDDLIPDSIRETNTDNSINLVYQDTILNLDIAKDLLNVPDTSVSVTVKLDSLKIDDRSITEIITLGDIAKAMIADGNILGTLIILSNGSSIPIDPITGLTSGEDTIDATSFFLSATIKTGYMDMLIKNSLPIDITDAIFQLKNTTDGAVIVQDTFPLIASGDFVTATYNLADKTVDGYLIAQIINFNSPGSVDPVYIDTSNNILIQMSIYDISLFEATAIFPAQNLITKQTEVEYDMGEGGPQLTEMTIDSGSVVISVINTVQDSVHVVYDMPYAKDALGNAVHFESVAPPAPPGGSVSIYSTFSLAGYSVDLKGLNGDKANTFYQEFTASIDSSGEVRTLSLDDSIVVVYGLVGIIPLELKGYIGQFEQNITDTTSIGFNIFDFIDGGEIHFNDINVNLNVRNEVGVDANFTINILSGKNKTTGESVNLDAPGIINTPIAVQRAFNNPFIPGITTIALNNANSNIKDLLEIFPDELSYNVDLSINPNGNVYNYQDFLLAGTHTVLSLDLELPLDVLASNVLLTDTFDMQISDTSFTNDVQNLELTLFADNGFPLNASVKIYFLDDYGSTVDSLDFSGASIKAGELDATCRVNTPAKTELKAVISGEQMSNILSSKQAALQAIFNTQSTPSCGETVKIYSDYALNLHLVGNLNYMFTTH